MTRYAYRALHASGSVHRGESEAANENALMSHLHTLNLELIEARPCRTSGGSSRASQRNVDHRHLIRITGQLADLLAAGIDLPQALRSLYLALTPSPLRDALMAIATDVTAGANVTQAFARHSRFFPPLYLTLLGAGEASGDLADAFLRLKRQLVWQDEIATALRRAVRYPLFLLTVACGVTCFMMLYVVPQMVTFLLSLGTALPFSTRILIGFAQGFGKVWWFMPLAGAGGVSFLLSARREGSRFALPASRLLLRLPLIGAILNDFACARVLTAFALLLQSGRDVPEALQSAAATAGNVSITARLMTAREAIIAGESVSAAMSSLLSPFALQLVKSGELCGRLGPTLDEAASLYEREAREKTNSLIGSLEPALTLLVGALLAWVVLSVLGPVYGSLGTLGRSL